MFMGRRRKKSPAIILSELQSLLSQAQTIFSDLICENNICEEENTELQISNGEILRNFTVLCIDKLRTPEHRCDCVVLGIIKTNTGYNTIIVITELKSKSYNVSHAIGQIEYCHDILNKIDQDFCSKFVFRGFYLPILIVKKQKRNSLLYKLFGCKGIKLTFHGKSQRLIIGKSSDNLESIISRFNII
jgi:hypothetical protein